jgi:hypothetical protein
VSLLIKKEKRKKEMGGCWSHELTTDFRIDP